MLLLKIKKNNKEVPKIAVGKIFDCAFPFFFQILPWLIGFGIFLTLPYFIPLAYEYMTGMQSSVPASYYEILNYLGHIASVAIYFAMVPLCRDWYTKSKASWKRASYEIITQLPKLLGTLILYALAVGLSSIALIIPGIIVYLTLCCSFPILLIEKTSITQSFSRSSALTKGNRWRIFLITVLGQMTVSTVGLLLLLVFGLQGHTLKIVQALLNPAFTAWYPIIQTFLYYDLREKKEGFDLELISSKIDQIKATVS